METVLKILIGLCCLLLVILVFLATFFLKYKPSPRSRSRMPTETNGSSTRSRMAARWAHMERGSASTRNEPSYADAVPGDDELVDDAGRHRTSDEVDPADFGALRPFHMTEDPHKSPGTFGASLVGTGPNGTRSFLKGWFGLDEPTSAGYNTRPDQREKSLNGDVLPMRATNGENTDELHPHIPVVPHHRIPTSEDHDWETHSQGSNV